MEEVAKGDQVNSVTSGYLSVPRAVTSSFEVFIYEVNIL